MFHCFLLPPSKGLTTLSQRDYTYQILPAVFGLLIDLYKKRNASISPLVPVTQSTHLISTAELLHEPLPTKAFNPTKAEEKRNFKISNTIF